jgi:hypothetical protein
MESSCLVHDIEKIFLIFSEFPELIIKSYRAYESLSGQPVLHNENSYVSYNTIVRVRWIGDYVPLVVQNSLCQRRHGDYMFGKAAVPHRAGSVMMYIS